MTICINQVCETQPLPKQKKLIVRPTLEGAFVEGKKFFDESEDATCKKWTNHKVPRVTLTLVDPLGQNKMWLKFNQLKDATCH